MKKMIKTDNLGQMSPSCLLLNPYLPLTLPLCAPKRMMYLFAVLAMLLLGGWNTQAWGAWYPEHFYAKLTVNTAPSGAGKVIVDTKYKEPTAESDWEDGDAWAYNNANIDFKISIKANDGYSLSSWSNGTPTYDKTQNGYGCYYYSMNTSSTSSSNPAQQTITANFTPNDYTVTYNANGGSVTPSNKTVTYTKTYGELATPTRSGYTFAGWYTAATGGSRVTASTKVTTTSDHTIHAHWTANTYYVAFNGNGSTGGSMSKESFTYDAAAKALTANAYSRVYTVSYNADGGTTASTTAANTTATYTFNGWEDRNSIVYNGTTYEYTTFDAPYYANTYSDLYNAFGYNKYNLIQHYVNNGKKESRSCKGDTPGLYPNKASVANMTTTAGGTVTLYANWTSASVTLPSAAQPGKVLEGWYNGETKVGEAGATYTPTANVTLKAKWIDKYTPKITGASAELSVGAQQVNAFSFTHTSNPTPHITVTSISNVNNCNGKVIEYDAANNKIIAHNAGTATIYFTQDETTTIKSYTSATYTYTVSKIANTLDVTVTTHEMFVDDELGEIINSGVAIKDRNNNDVAVTVASTDEDLLRYVSASDKVIAPNTAKEMFGASKKVTLTFSQPETYKYTAASKTIDVTVKKYVTSFTGSAYNLKVDGIQTANYSYTNTSASQPTTDSNDDFYYTIDEVTFTNAALNKGTNLVTFNPSNKQITACNAGTAKITLHQKETYKYTGATKSFDVAVTKHSNTIKVKGSTSYSSSIYVDSYDNEFAFTATNTDYTNCPISVTQKAGTDIATYYPDQKTVYSSYKLGTATWTITQPENYKYQAGNGIFTVNVVQQPITECYVLNYPAEKDFGTYGPTSSYEVNGPADKLYFKAKKNGYNYFVAEYSTDNGGSWKDICMPDLSDSYPANDYGPFQIPESNITHIRFGAKFGATLHKWVKDVKITRKTWLNIATDNGNNGTLTINKKSDGSAINPGQTGVAQSKIYWSCAGGGNLKIACDNSHFSFSTKEITGTDCNNGTTDITVSYTNTEAGTETATVTVYNQMYRQTFTVKGVIEKADQLIAWHNDILRVGQSYTEVATATTLVTYESSDESIIRVDEDGEGHKTILTAVGTGTVNITATAEETSFYAEKSDVKSIKVTDKQIQWIDWNQSLFGLKLGGANVTMNAVAASDVEGCESSRLIEYSSSNESVVKVVNNNQLQIIGVGTAIITAVQVGGFDTDGHDYERAETEKTVIVRDPNAPCESFAYQQGQEVKMDCGWNAWDKQTKTSEINFNGIIPATGTLRYKGEYRKVAINYFDGTMTVEQYIPGEDWKPVTGGDLGKPSIGTYKTANLTFDRRATKMRVKVTDGLGYHYFTDCQVTQARFIETTTPVDFNLNVGQQQNQVIYLSYSNITDGLSLTLAQGANSHFSVDKPFIEGSCGSAAKNVALTITYHPTAEETNAQDVLTITDGTTSCKVVLTGSATRVNRHINWDHADETDIYTVQTETLSAEARTDLNELAGVVTFSLASSSTATGAISMENVLSFTSAGVANVVAYTTDDARYNAAPNVTKVFNVSKTPTTISTLPVLEAVTSGTAVGEIELNGWQATNTINGGVVEGTLEITSVDLTNAGTNTVTLTFTPSNPDMYVGCTSKTTIVVNKATSVATPSAANIVYGQKVSASLLSNEGTEGTWAWNTGNNEAVLDAGTHEGLAVHFTPASGNYTELDATVTLTVEKATPLVTPQATDIELGQIVSASALTTAVGDVSGTWTWHDDDADNKPAQGAHTLYVDFMPDDADNYNVLTNIPVTLNVNMPATFVFSGDGDWTTAGNWNIGDEPETPVDVVVDGNVVISTDVTVSSLTIGEGSTVTLTETGSLTLGSEASEDRTAYGDLHVEAGGQVILGKGALKVHDFILDASLGGLDAEKHNQTAKSGQVTNAEKIEKQGNAYFDLSFDPSGKISYGWYDFTVPFEVNIAGGIYRIGSTDDRLMVSGTHFMIMEADEANRANGGKGWKNKNSGVLQPGKLYTITFNYSKSFDQNTFRFMWNGNGSLSNGEKYNAQYAAGSEASLRGWNGMGNGMLRHGYPKGNYKMQMYNHSTNTYELISGQKTFAVGSAFFVQVPVEGDIDWTAATATGERPLYAPRHEAYEVEEFCLSLRQEDANAAADVLYFSASEEATEAYVIGHDLLKMGTPTDSKVARLWATKGGKKLCDVEAGLANNNAEAPLSIYAPQTGTYILSADEAPANTSLYLTYNGRVIWNLSYSPYTLDLTKGTTEGYGLKLYVNRITTDIDDVQGDGAQCTKVLMDNKIYIIMPNGAMYDATGKKVQ